MAAIIRIEIYFFILVNVLMVPYLVMLFSGQLFQPLIVFDFQTVFGSFRSFTIKWLSLTVLVLFKLLIMASLRTFDIFSELK